MKFMVLLFCLTNLKMFAQGVIFNEEILIKNTKGGFINLKSFDSIMNTSLYTLKMEMNEDKSLNHLQIIPKTDSDFAFEKEQEALAKKPFVMKAPDFTVTDNQGKEFTLSKLRNKVVFLHLGSIKHEKSYEFIDELNELHNLYKNDNSVQIISFNFDDDLTESEKKQMASKITPPLVFEANKAIKGYGIGILPIESVVPKYFLKKFNTFKFWRHINSFSFFAN